MVNDLARIRRKFRLVAMAGIGLTGALVISRALSARYRDGVLPFPVRAVKAWWVWRRLPTGSSGCQTSVLEDLTAAPPEGDTRRGLFHSSP